MTPASQPDVTRRPAGFRLVLGMVVVLAVCEVAILQLYVGALQRVTDLTVELEDARGTAVVADARALRCNSLGRQK